MCDTIHVPAVGTMGTEEQASTSYFIREASLAHTWLLGLSVESNLRSGGSLVGDELGH